MSGADRNAPLLITGATGYIGGRLIEAMVDRGLPVRCLARNPDRLASRKWRSQVEVVEADVLRAETLPRALENVATAYYLVHGMGAGAGYRERDLEAARNFGEACRDAGVRRIVYLSGLANEKDALSPHLRSRLETGDALRESGVPVVEFRAAVIIGSGSLSFEVIRYLCERLPVMVCPRWVYTRTQPIGVRDVIAYLIAAAEREEITDGVIEIGGADVLSYREMMLGYAEERGLRRWLIPVPVLTPRLSSYWLHIVTPVPAVIARPLIEGLRNENIVRSDAARRLFPEIEPVSYRESVRRTLVKLDAGEVETSWSDAQATSRGGSEAPVTLTTHEGMIREERALRIDAPPAEVFAVVESLGGEKGWLYMNWAWRIRGLVDRLLGGVGLRRGRRDPVRLRAGDAVDFWRVERIEKTGGEYFLRLRAEMKVPGRAWLEFRAASADDVTRTDDQGCAAPAHCRLTQTAYFAPHGLAGFGYWYLLYPIHALIFSGLISRIRDQAHLVDDAPRYSPSSADGP